MDNTAQTAAQRYQAVATELYTATGKRPTIAEVRKAAGSGSFSTITKAMQGWKAPASSTENTDAQATNTGSKELAASTLPADLLAKVEDLAGVVNSVMSEIWSVAAEQASEKITLAQSAARLEIESINKAAEAAAAAAELEAEEQQEQLAELADEQAITIEKLELELKEAANKLLTAEQQVTDTNALLTTKTDNILLLNNKIAGLESKCTAALAAQSKAEQTLAATAAELSTLTKDYNKSLSTAAEQAAATLAAHNKALTLEVSKASKAEGRTEEIEKQLAALQLTLKENQKELEAAKAEKTTKATATKK